MSPLKSSIRFAIAESDFIFRQTLTESICRSPFYHMEVSASNGYELISSFGKKTFDFMLIDLFMPVLSGIEAIKFIRGIARDIPIFCYSATYQADIFNILSPVNAIIYCEKNTTSIQEVLNTYFNEGPAFYPQYLAKWKHESEKKMRFLSTGPAQQHFNATELRLMKLTYEGFTNKEIADSMCLSKRTVDTYITRLTERLGLRTKTDLIKYTVDKGIYNTSM